MAKRRRRKVYTPEFKAEAVRLFNEGDRSLGEVAKELGVARGSLWRWVEEAEGGSRTQEVVEQVETPEQELKRLRKKVRELEMEKEILKKRRLNRPGISGDLIFREDSVDGSIQVFARSEGTGSSYGDGRRGVLRFAVAGDPVRRREDRVLRRRPEAVGATG